MENNENESVEDIFSLGIINEEETSGYKKIQNYLNGIIDEPAFQEKILKLRGKYKIPDKGLEKDDFPWDIIYKEDFNNDLQNLCFIDLGLSFEWFGCIKNYVCYNNLDCASGSMFSLLDLNFRLNIFPRQTGTVDGEVKDLQEKAKLYKVSLS